MPTIFISYRRDESTGYAGRIHERLAGKFGTRSVFMDLDDIKPGKDFIQVIEDHIASCDFLLALIGKQWLTLQTADGRRRIDDPNDFVRIEIARALARNVRIIPVLINNAHMPAEPDLPQDIRGLCRHQAVELSEERWDYDFGKLTRALSGDFAGRWSRRKMLGAAGALSALAFVAALWMWQGDSPDVSGRWTADLQYDTGVTQAETFVFRHVGDEIRGTASFLGVARTIVNAKVDHDRLSFETRTSEVSGNETRDATHQYDGRVGSQDIQFVMQTTGGFSDHPPITFSARRTGSGP